MGENIHRSLVDIVGEAHVSTKKEEFYFYGRDPGLMPAHEPEYVVAPRTTEEMQKIVLLANRGKIPIVPMGGGMSLAGLTIPLKGGIVVDTKRMRSIVELNRQERYVVVEGACRRGSSRPI
jgi:glycolate oxidase